jgi:hypothetical protein
MCSIAKSINGWTNTDLSYEWITKGFDPETRDAAKGLPRVLLLEGHSSHYSEKVLRFC